MGKRKALMKASELREKRKKRREQLLEVSFVLALVVLYLEYELVCS